MSAFSVFAVVVLVFVSILPPLEAGGSGPKYRDLVEAVSGEEMMETVQHLEGFGSRIYNETAIVSVESYIYDRFTSLDLKVEYQDFIVRDHVSRNIVATLQGSSAGSPQYLFGAHYDSATMTMYQYSNMDDVPAPGADDDASGVAAVLELARVLHDQEVRNSVKFVAFAAEETGLNGSAYFVQHERTIGTEYAGTAIMDMIGYKLGQENRVNVYVDHEEDPFANATAESISMYGVNLSMSVIVDPTMAYSDHYPFWIADYPSMLMIEEINTTTGVLANPYYHTSNDKSEHLSKELMTEVTKALLGAVLVLNEPLDKETSPLLIFAIATVAAASIIIILYIGRRKVSQ